MKTLQHPTGKFQAIHRGFPASRALFANRSSAEQFGQAFAKTLKARRADGLSGYLWVDELAVRMSGVLA